jgi:hypothetical protein
MIVTRLQLYCANHAQCGHFYPAEGPVDGAIYTPVDLRKAARNAGWVRRIDSAGVLVDLCATCDADGERR